MVCTYTASGDKAKTSCHRPSEMGQSRRFTLRGFCWFSPSPPNPRSKQWDHVDLRGKEASINQHRIWGYLAANLSTPFLTTQHFPSQRKHRNPKPQSSSCMSPASQASLNLKSTLHLPWLCYFQPDSSCATLGVSISCLPPPAASSTSPSCTGNPDTVLSFASSSVLPEFAFL